MYSHQKISLKADKFIQEFNDINSGDLLYRLNTLFHSWSSRGGSHPTSGRHSTIDNPEPVTRVTPPITTIIMTIIMRKDIQITNSRSPDLTTNFYSSKIPSRYGAKYYKIQLKPENF
tara:strand:+ start:73 stop:423 length:351 start_codon:yes stop_codon:yes gene_type:complete